MKIDYARFLQLPASQKQSFINFYNTFGYLRFTNAFTRKEASENRREYRRLYVNHYKEPWLKFLLKRRQGFVPNFYEESDYYLREVLIKKINPLVKEFSRDRAIYLGSDGSCFNGKSFEWHRDWFARSPMLKFNIYMNHSLHFGGKHRIIPGSQFTQDEFSQSIGNGGAWPFAPTSESWLNEFDYFPKAPRPRQHFLKKLVGTIKDTNDFPSVRISTSPLDIILFDQRTWHMVEKPFPAIPQMLATALFAIPPGNESSEDLEAGKSVEAKQLGNSYVDELAALYAAERMMIGCNNYGSKFNHEFTSNLLHFQVNGNIGQKDVDADSLDIRLSDGSYRNNIGALMEGYRLTARNIREVNENRKDYYSIEMLGINCSNIRIYGAPPGRNPVFL